METFPTLSGSEYIDLHIHSDASDGSLPVLQIVEDAMKMGLRAISVTDHDTVDGVREMLHKATASPLDILPGVEISADYPSGGMHILGYLFDPEAPSLNDTLALLQDARHGRNIRIVDNLQQLGIDITYEEVQATAVRGQVGRPHFAQVLVKKGVSRTVDEAFAKLLRRGKPGYASKYRLSSTEAIRTILDAGGIPVLAHPGSLGIHREEELESLLLELKDVGLKGIEVYYSDYSFKQQTMYEHLAVRNGLVMTGGTDFHGAAKPNIHLGVGKGDLRIPYQLVEELRRIQATQ
jgi:predicted metal-dependent phosphoesterase TrpH